MIDDELEHTEHLEHLVRRVLMPGFAGSAPPDWLITEIDRGLGGVCLFGHNIDSVAQTRTLTDALRAAGLPLVCADEEGGIVSRLGTIAGSRHVGAAALGVADDLSSTREVFAANGADLRSAGIDWDLAPVADVTSDPDNPVIGVRSFGTDPRRVGEHVAAAVQGLHDAGVLACAKHFPGHGDTSVDSHLGLPRIDIDLQTLISRDLVPFVAAVGAGVDAIMTAHIVVPVLDDAPATTSTAWIRMLRADLGFTGLITSDAMDMRAIAGTVGVGEGSVRALIAGVDLVGLGNPVLGPSASSGEVSVADRDEQIYAEVRDAVLEAVRSGRLSTLRLAEAAGRVDTLAADGVRLRLQADEAGTSARSVSWSGLGLADERVAAQAVQVRGSSAGTLHRAGARDVLVRDLRRRRNVAAGATHGSLVDALLTAVPNARSADAVAAATDPAQPGETADDALVIVVVAQPHTDPIEGQNLADALRACPDAVVICTGWVPDDALAGVVNLVQCFGEDLPTAAAVVGVLAQGAVAETRATAG